MPQVVAAAIAQSAMTAPAVAATTAAGTAAAQTAALELAKQQAIKAGVQQMGTEAAKTAAVEASKTAAAEAAKQGIAQAGTEAAKQTGVEAAKQGIFSANPAGLPPTAGNPIVPPGSPATPLPPAGSEMVKSLTPGQEAFMRSSVADASGTVAPTEFLPPPGSETASNFLTNPPPLNTPPVDASSIGNQALGQGLKPPTGIEQGLKLNPVESLSKALPPPSPVDTAKDFLSQGFEKGLKFVKDNPKEVGMGLMAVGQYLNQPEEPKKKKYAAADMSGFQPSVPKQQPFQRSYDWQGYAVGGPVEMMSAQNAVGDNQMYPQAGLQTAMYSNPMVQRPMPTNVVSQGVDASVDPYTGEPRFASGGTTDDEYDKPLTKAQKAARGLSKSFEDMEKERAKELSSLKSMGDKFDEGIIPRSRTQQLTSPYSAAMNEYAKLAKKSKVPVVEMPKTNLGDIDSYMDTPIDAANGGIMHGLGGYSDGGRLLKGPGDGVSDSIPAVIGNKQPARLADGEFVIPARIVSELGNGSTEAGARKLYAMMERVQASRKKSIGKKKVAVNSKSDKHLPA
jgi:hypothetical protein